MATRVISGWLVAVKLPPVARHSTDSGATFSEFANIEEADNVTFGKAAPVKLIRPYLLSVKLMVSAACFALSTKAQAGPESMMHQ
jgi:hypothetical protein